MGTLFGTGAIVITMAVLNGNFKVLNFKIIIPKILIFSYGVSIAVILFIFGSILLYFFAYLLVSAVMKTAPIYNTFGLYLGHPLFYFLTLFLFSCTLFDFGV